VHRRFSSEEMKRRLALARGLMADRDLDTLILYGPRGRQAGICWLAQFQDLNGCYLVVPREGEPTVLVAFLNHLPNAQEQSSLPTVWGGDDPERDLADRLRRLGANRVGLVGGDTSFGTGMPFGTYQYLRDSLPDLEFLDVTGAFMRLLLVKSDEEIEQMREAASLTDLALATIAREARPGVTEAELVALGEHAYRVKGADVWISYLRSMPMDAPTGCVPAQNPTDRKLEAGDVIIMELSAMSAGYLGQVLWPVFVGAQPTDEWRRLFDVAHETYQALTATVRDGARTGDAVKAAKPILAGGYTIRDSLLHGIGLGISGPVVGPEDLENPPADGGDRFERGMGVVLQPNPITRDERMGIQLGAAGIVRDDGFEPLQALPSEPLIAG
jgi:Xaa-Pro dipeptidase